MSESPLPKQIQAQVDEAEAVAKLLEEEQNPKPAEEPTPDELAAVPPEPEPEPTPPEPEPEPTPDEDEGKWKARYDTLLGKYDAEVPRLQQANNELSTQVQNLQQQVQQLVDVANQPDPVETPKEILVSEKDEEKFGSDLIDLQRRVVQEAMAQVTPELERLREENTSLKEQLKTVGTQSEKTSVNQFNDSLTRAVPNWRQIDTDPGWLNWLAEVDPMSGFSRQTYLRNAIMQQDVERTAKIFIAFMETRPDLKPADPSPTPPPSPEPSDDLNRQVAPSKTTTSATTPVETEKKVWSQADISAALDPRKLAKMTLAEQTAVMSEIDAAQAEGRVTL